MSGYTLPRPISAEDDTTAFDSGESSLDDYLRKRALANHIGGASRCFVTCLDGRVVGYYAIASGSVSHSGTSGKFRRNMPDPIPVILLSRLAIDRKHQGCGLGENLLRDAIARCVEVADQIGVRAILVHALHDEAKRFYLRYQFEPTPTDPLHLMLLIKDAKASVGGLGQQADQASQRRALTDDMVAEGADRDHLDSLTDEQFRRLVALSMLANAERLRELIPDGAESALALAREITGFVDRELRTVTLSDGTGVLLGDDNEATDDEIREAFDGED